MENNIEQITIFGVNEYISLTALEVKDMYDRLRALYHESYRNGLVDIGTWDRSEIKTLLKLPEDFR
jgi:hypothetical protein